MSFPTTIGILPALFVVACGSDTSTSQGPTHADAATRPDSGTPTDSGPPRHFRMATVGEKLLVTGSDLGLQLGDAHVSSDADVVGQHHEIYGVPWDAFESSSAPPAEWTAVMERLSEAAKATGKPVFLSVSMLNGTRETLAAKTRIENGQVKTNDSWAPRCYDFRTAADRVSKRAAYLRYVDAMVDFFQPTFLNVAIEVNLFFEKCPAATGGVIDVIDATYDAVKAKHPDVLVFPSFQIDHLLRVQQGQLRGSIAA